MQEFEYMLTQDECYTVCSYKGDEQSVVIPAVFLGRPVTILYDRLFKGHKEITSISIPDRITDIGSFVFDGCEGLHSITLPKALTSLWSYAFARCSFEELTIPAGVETAPPFLFKDCKRLKKVTFLGNMKKVHNYSFCGCNKSIVIQGADNAVVGDDIFGDKLENK